MKIGLRLMLFNCLLIFLPLAAMVLLHVFEGELLTSQENTMASQARVLAATAPNRGLEAWSKASLTKLEGRTTTRLRILGVDGRILADSSRYSPAESATIPVPPRRTEATAPTADDPFSTLAYQIGSLPFRIWRAISPPAAPAEASDDDATAKNPAVLSALQGHYGSSTMVSKGQRSVTLYSAMPIEGANGAVVGVVLASQSTWRTLQALYQVRLTLFQIFLASLLVAIALSFLMSLTISRPLKQLRTMAEGFVDQWGRPVGRFRPLKGRDELADLSRSFVRLGDGLADHVRFIESFASDLAHELRNPLASIRAAGELLGMNQAGETARLSAIILSESDRIDRLAALSRDLSRLDVAVARAARVPVDTRAFLDSCISAWKLQGFALNLAPEDESASDPSPRFLADPDFLRQAFDKLIENALDYSPEPGTVSLSYHSRAEDVQLVVSDRGPGIPDDRKTQVFQRFATDRREHGHTGLGLALAKAIAEGLGGKIFAEDRSQGGTKIIVEFPRQRSAP